MGMIHGRHRTSVTYDIDRINDLVRAVDPDYILCEIPPDRLETALREYRQEGVISEPRVKVFPEYVDAIIPLSEDMPFELIPCAGWTKAMADDRRAKLREWETTRPDEFEEVQRAWDEAERLIEAEGRAFRGADDPAWIHTWRYDEIVRRGMEPYNRLFNEDLGPGGWDNINTAHYAFIVGALNEHVGAGKRFLITFGSWHKYWVLDHLRQRDDVVVRSLGEFIE